MRRQVADMTERQLRLGVVKLALALVGMFVLIAFAMTLLAERGQNLAVTVLLVSLSATFLANGVLAVLKIFDWFEARKSKNG